MAHDGEASRDPANELLARVLGEDNVNGFHIDVIGRSTGTWDHPQRGDGTRFPCIDEVNRYSGCLGSECRATSCWAGPLVPSAYHARLARPLPFLEVAGCTCHTCAHITEMDATGGRYNRPLLDCARGHFDRPITGACLARKRVPETVEIPCPDYEQTDQLRPEVEARRAGRQTTQAKAKRPNRASR